MKYSNKKKLENIINKILSEPDKFFFKGIKSVYFKNLKKKILNLSKKVFGADGEQNILLKRIGLIQIPFFSYGNISTINLWDLEDIFLFSYYLKHKDEYVQAYDLGANIGLHSIIFSKIGYKSVKCFEPEIKHLTEIKKNFKINKIDNVKIHKKAVYNKSKKVIFNIIHGNTQSSHILNAKKNPYGKITRYSVNSVDFKKILPMKKKSLFKIDIENVEGVAIERTNAKNWNYFDAFIEVGDKYNAKKIFQHCRKINLNIFSHKTKWKKVKKLSDMPFSYHDGLVFLSKKNQLKI